MGGAVSVPGTRSVLNLSMLILAAFGAVLVTAASAQNRRLKAPAQNTRVQSPAQPAEAKPSVEFKIPDGHPLTPALEAAYDSRKAMDAVKDYTARFSKEELIGNRLTKQFMDMKFRQHPFSVYLNFYGPEAGRKVLYSDITRGNLLVHAEGIKAIAGTQPLALNHPEVLKENLHPITQIGMSNLLNTVIKRWEDDTKFGEVEVKVFPGAKLGETPCIVIQTVHPQARRQFLFHKTMLYIDKQTKLPIRVEQYGFPRSPGGPAPLVEKYTYTNIKTNVGLGNQDFDPRNLN